MSDQNTPSQMAGAIYHATVKELAAANDPKLQHEVLKSLDEMLRGGDQNAAEVTSAIALTAHDRHALESKLHAKFGRSLTFVYHVDASLLGGVIVKVGDKIIDGSLASKLNAMAENLLGGAR